MCNLEIPYRLDIVRTVLFLIHRYLASRWIIGLIFALNAGKGAIHLVEIKALNQSNDIVMGPINYEELTNYFSWAVLIGTGGWGLYSVIDAFSIFFKDEVTFYNPENGKTITFRKHPPKGFDQEMLDFWK